MLKRGTHELEIHVEKMYNHLLERINQVLFNLSLIIGLGFSTLHLIYHLVKQITDSELDCIFFWCIQCHVQLFMQVFSPFFFFRLGYRPILDAMKTFAKSENPIDIEVRTRLHFNHIWLAHHCFSVCPDRFEIVFTEC